MPKISDEKRAARRAQILDAAWICFQKEGLHQTTMDDIIRASSLSAGAVYSYFPSKDDLIHAAVMTSLTGLSALVEPVLKASPPPSPDEFVRQITERIAGFTARPGYDLRRIALLGWSEAQRNERLRKTKEGFYLAFRNQVEDVARQWMEAGVVAKSADPKDIARTVLATIFGYVVQSAIIGDVEPADIAAGMAALRSD